MAVVAQEKTALALALFDIGAIRFGSFRLRVHERYPDAPLSPIYIDLRLVRRFPEVKRLAVDHYEALAASLDFDLLADTPTAATPFTSALADRLDLGMVSPRVSGKSYGTGAQVDGLLPEDGGKTALLIDDVITAADSKLEAAAILEAAGLVVRDIAILVDREQGGRERLAQRGYALHAALTLSELLALYVAAGRLDQDQYCQIQQRLQAHKALTG